jgi:hypothetical protein
MFAAIRVFVSIGHWAAGIQSTVARRSTTSTSCRSRRTQIVLPDLGNIALIAYELHDWRDAQSFPNRRRTHSDWAVSTM